MSAGDAPLPGLEPVREGARTHPLEHAARRTLAALHDRDALRDEHALHAQLVVDLARVIGESTRMGKASAAAMAAGQLLACLEALMPEDTDDTAADPFAELTRELEAAAREEARRHAAG